MAFPLPVVQRAWQRAGGRCECVRKKCGHTGRCNKQLVWDNRGNNGARGAWEAHHVTASGAGGPDTLSNCEILCVDCHKNTPTYGG
jgi:5-methylcytosine-specific restriction endonuclease McrA